MENDEDNPWFAAKTYGYGWGLPATWQGWVTVGIYVALLTAALIALTTPTARLVCAVVLTIVFVGIVAWKGERPVKWRWGRR